MKSIVTTEKLTVGYGGNSILNGTIDIDIDKGQFCAIVGINGVGKSTLMRTLARLQSPITGAIELEQKALEAYNANELSRMLSVVLTDAVATKNLTVQELIALGRQPHTNWLGILTEKDKKAIFESLRLFELGALKDKKCYELSDGLLQRALVARAMAQETPLILLDEPTTHLDLHHKVQILKLLKNLAHEQGKAIVFTTHDIATAIQLCDKILILDGSENPFGTPCELIEQGHFKRLFPDDTVTFDEQTGTFKIMT